MSADSRHFHNSFEDFTPSLKDNEIVTKDDGGLWTLHPLFVRRLTGWRERLLARLAADLDGRHDWADGSVYTGTAGLVMLHLHLNTTTGSAEHLQRAAELVDRLPPARSGRRRVTLLCGDAGQLAVAAVAHHRAGRGDKVQRRVKTILDMAEEVTGREPLPDELLYGRAGYLSVLLYLRRELGGAMPDPQPAMKKTVSAILASGAAMSSQQRSPSPLMFAWHDKRYLGAAHGVGGIVTLLLQVAELMTPAELSRLVRPTVDFLVGLRLDSANYPSSLESVGADRLVHWCHGAPGLVHMLCHAHQVFGDERYLQLARQSADLVWRRGLLGKGYGLCHGAAGNAYTFVHLFRATKEPLYLYRACRFAEWCSEYGKHGCRTPDRPVSLFEGVAGTAYFLADLLLPAAARFPSFCF